MTDFVTKARSGRREALAAKAALDVMLFAASTPLRLVGRQSEIETRRVLAAEMKPLFVRHQSCESAAASAKMDGSDISITAILEAANASHAPQQATRFAA